MIKTGNPVEFTRSRSTNHQMGDGEIGIAVEDERRDHTVLVELASGETYLARHIHAYAWGGWLPDALEPVWLKHNSGMNDGCDDFA